MRSNVLRFFEIFCAVSAVVVLSCCMACSSAPTPDLAPHLVPNGDKVPIRHITEREPAYMSQVSGELTAAEYRARIDELYAAVVYDGMQPIFVEDDPVAEVYDAALEILNRYVLNEWYGNAAGEYNTVHALHDYLVCNVEYDFALYDRYRDGETDLGTDPAFHIDGALVGKTAVCDGLSRAFEFLCAVEGIECARVTGTFSSVPHAWNKVKIGGKWFNIDVTADAAHYSVGGGEYRKQLSHGYFLLSDKSYSEFLPQTHVFGAQPFTADVDHDYYDGSTVDIGGKTYSLDIKSYDELLTLFNAVKSAHKSVGKLEVRLDYAGRVQINSADMYRNDLSAAYAELGNADFGFNGNTAPYFRYPNGVYLLLFYY